MSYQDFIDTYEEELLEEYESMSRSKPGFDQYARSAYQRYLED